MKKLLPLILITLIFAACEKSPFDYRNKYIGNYNYTNVYTSLDSTGAVASRTTTYFGRAKTDGDNYIVLEFEETQSQKLKIDSDGNLFNACGAYVGHFESESKIQFSLDTKACSTISLSGSATVAVVGERKY